MHATTAMILVLTLLSGAYSIERVNEIMEEKISQIFAKHREERSLGSNGVYMQNQPAVKVTALLSETGNAGYLGSAIKAGIEKAVDDMCLNKPYNEPCSIEVEYLDTKSSPEVALDLFIQSYSKGVTLFIGLVTNEEAERVAAYASTHAPTVTIISPSSTATSLCKYKQLYRMTMDDRGYAEVLYDMTLDLQDRYNVKNLPVYLIHQDDMYGKGLVSDVQSVFQDWNANFDSLRSVHYSDQESAIQVVEEISSALENTYTERAIIVLIGLQAEAEFILSEASKFPVLRRFPWVLSDSLALSHIEIPSNIEEVYGLNYRGSLLEDNNRLKSKKHKLMEYLRGKNVAPMAQPLLAYDAILLIFQAYEKSQVSSQYIKQNMVYEGLTGTIDFSSCHERGFGEYALAISKHNDNLRFGVVAEKWIVLQHYSVYAVESSPESFQQQLRGQSIDHSSSILFQELTPEAMLLADIQSTAKVDLTSTYSPAAGIFRRDLIEALETANDQNCERTAKIIVSTRDDVSDKPINTTYSLNTFPETLSIPTHYGFILEGSCLTATHKIQIVKVCPSAKIAGTELTCTIRHSQFPKNTNLANVQFKASTGLYIGAAVCYAGAAGCFFTVPFTWGASIPICAGVTAGCGAVTASAAATSSAGKYVCTELFRQGHMSPELMLADMNFALTYGKRNPITRKGYDILGPKVAQLMKNSETITQIAEYIAIPWAEEMAYLTGYREEGNEFGSWVMFFGSIVCAVVGGAYMYANPLGLISALLIAVIGAVTGYRRYPKHLKNE